MDEAGALHIATTAGEVIDEPPVAWQDGPEGAPETVGAAYVLAGDRGAEVEYGFRIGSHDPSRPLVVDPAFLVYCGYLGGDRRESVRGVAVGGAGNLHGVGTTGSAETTFPVKVGPDLTHNGLTTDAFVCRVAADGKGFEYCGYIGGRSWEVALAIALDTTGAAYVAGYATAGLPTKHGPGLVNRGRDDAFVAKVAPAGTHLIYCGYIGGAPAAIWDGDDTGFAIAVDRSGNAYRGGQTASSEKSFPVKIGPDLTQKDGPYMSGAGDGFVAKVALTLLEATGTPKPGSRITFDLTAADDTGRRYQLASSFSTGPITIDTRTLALGYDGLLWISVSGLVPTTFENYTGFILANGHAPAALYLPDIPQIVGLDVHTAFVTLEASAPSGVRSISNTYSPRVVR